MVSENARAWDAEPDPGLNSTGVMLDPESLLALHDGKIAFDRLAGLIGKSILAADQFDRGTVVELCKFAALLERTEIASHHPLDGKICITAFFEASTRTRLSFESAVLRLDGKILSVPDAKVTGIAKGESLEDIGEMFNGYGDLVIMRHPETDSIDRISRNLTVPLVNAGNGSGQHPTQALLDWYALLKWKPELSIGPPKGDKLHLGIVGTPGSMRAVNSFVRMALLFDDAFSRITVVSEINDPLGPGLKEVTAKAPVEVECVHDLQAVLPSLDVIYMNSIAFLGDNYERMGKRFKLGPKSKLKPECVILHPLARRDELSPELDDTAHNLYFAEAAGAVFVRQALLICILDRIGTLPNSVLYLAS